MAIQNKIAVGVLVMAMAYVYYSRTNVKWGPTVTTNSGSIRGSMSMSRGGREYFNFLQIPYAQPPVGNLRFSTPKPVEKWEGVRDGHVQGDMCPQINYFTNFNGGNEDCLHLNIHTPKLNPKKALPVLVFIHGGAFVLGDCTYGGPTYFMDEDVIYACVQYRIGVLGFSSTGDKNIRGNMGMKDQVLALKWIKENVHHFGGDPNQMTVWGQSAGGAAVHYLTLSESSKGLFQKAYSNSGAATSPWSFARPETAIERTKNWARDVGCPTHDSTKMVECLRGKSSGELIEAYRKDSLEFTLNRPSKDGILFVPTVELVDDEETFMAEYPYDILVQGKAHRIPWMSSISRDEGLLASQEFRRDPEALGRFEKDWAKSMQTNFYLEPALSKEKAAKASVQLKEFYLNNRLDGELEEKLSKYTEMLSDALFAVGPSTAAAVQRQFSPVYLYWYNRTGSGVGHVISNAMAELQERYNPIIEWSLVAIKLIWRSWVLGIPMRDYGATHGQDGTMYFEMFGSIQEGDPDYNLSKQFVKLLIQFATTEDGATLDFGGVHFTPNGREKGALQYLKVDEDPGMIKEPFAHRTQFWHSINFPQLFSAKK